MKTKELKIEVPEGFEIDKENSSFEKIVFKKKEDTKSRSWKEYCERKIEKNEVGHFIGTDSTIRCCVWCNCEYKDAWRNILPSKELAKAFLAMMQLISLRKEWIGDWEPDWKDEYAYKYCITGKYNDFEIHPLSILRYPLSFPTKRMAEDFRNCFKDLLDTAKPLI